MEKTTSTLMFTNRYGRLRSYEISPQFVILLVLLVMTILCSAILYSGFRLGTDRQARSQLAEIAALQALARQQRNEIAAARKTAQDNLDALTLRLGRMQAQMLRLEALGERLVAQADLDAGEFSFAAPPSVGGPGNRSEESSTTVPDFIDMLEEMDVAVADRENQLSLLERLLMHRELNKRIVPSGQAVKNGLLSSKFGMRIDPFTGKRTLHEGIDIAARKGSDILAVADGVVIWSGKRTGYGNLVEIDHGGGYITRYGHNKAQLVKAGDTVRKGQTIALLGSTGRSTGPHVHIEVLHDGKQVNPADYLNNQNPSR
ncbi:MAG: peptidoglycan DD-metalloendopeptidase family protein [Gammaproteobacteria bacterium]|jgi:murein DD-endopeptidase MepM/ murein hydrolase activator NlpD